MVIALIGEAHWFGALIGEALWFGSAAYLAALVIGSLAVSLVDRDRFWRVDVLPRRRRRRS